MFISRPGKVLEKYKIPTLLEKAWKFVIFIYAFTLNFK